MVEKRATPRLRHLKVANVVFNGGMTMLSCRVRDATADGARLECGEAYLVPRDFQLVIRGEIAPRSAHRVWVKGAEMGIRFTP
jgi:hypothetical protein